MSRLQVGESRPKSWQLRCSSWRRCSSERVRLKPSTLACARQQVQNLGPRTLCSGLQRCTRGTPAVRRAPTRVRRQSRQRGAARERRTATQPSGEKQRLPSSRCVTAWSPTKAFLRANFRARWVPCLPPCWSSRTANDVSLHLLPPPSRFRTLWFSSTSLRPWTRMGTAELGQFLGGRARKPYFSHRESLHCGVQLPGAGAWSQ